MSKISIFGKGNGHDVIVPRSSLKFRDDEGTITQHCRGSGLGVTVYFSDPGSRFAVFSKIYFRVKNFHEFFSQFFFQKISANFFRKKFREFFSRIFSANFMWRDDQGRFHKNRSNPHRDDRNPLEFYGWVDRPGADLSDFCEIVPDRPVHNKSISVKEITIFSGVLTATFRSQRSVPYGNSNDVKRVSFSRKLRVHPRQFRYN